MRVEFSLEDIKRLSWAFRYKANSSRSPRDDIRILYSEASKALESLYLSYIKDGISENHKLVACDD